MRANPGIADLDPEWIAAQAPRIAWDRLSVAVHAEVGSTNDEAAALARAGAPAGLLVVADHQTAGRGRKGRRWLSVPGSSLCFSLVLRPGVERRAWPLLSLAAAAALARCLQAVAADVALKWPNDVLIGGRKVAGILIETVDRPGGSPAAVIGVGVNVARNSIPPGMEDSAASVSSATGSDVLRQSLLVSFLGEFQRTYLLFEAGRHREIVDEWESLAPMSRNTGVWLEDGEGPREAVTCGLTDLGCLRVRFPDGGEGTVLAGDVSLRYSGEKPITGNQ